MRLTTTCLLLLALLIGCGSGDDSPAKSTPTTTATPTSTATPLPFCSCGVAAGDGGFHCYSTDLLLFATYYHCNDNLHSECIFCAGQRIANNPCQSDDLFVRGRPFCVPLEATPTPTPAP